MYCENCGAKMTEDAKFCEGCGHRQQPVQSGSQAENSSIKAEAAGFENRGPNMQKQDDYYSEAKTYSQYQAPRTAGDMEEVLGMKDYLKMHLLMMVPILNLVLLFIWGFGDGINKNKKNLAKTMLIFMAISIIPTILSIIFILTPMFSYSEYSF